MEFNNDKTLLVACGLFSCFPISYMINSFIEWCSIILRNTKDSHQKVGVITVYITAYITIFAYWMPVFVCEYPGILDHDSVSQFFMAYVWKWLNNHLPIAHTFLIYLSQRVSWLITGDKTDATSAVAVYSIIQMLIMTAIFAGVIAYAYLRKINLLYIIILLIYFSICPINCYYSQPSCRHD